MPGLPLPSPVRAGGGAQGGPQYAQVDALLVERNSQRRIVRATGVARMTITKRLKNASAPAWTLPRRYRRHCWYFTDQWKAYTTVLPRWQHRPCPKGEGQTSLVEAINCSLRQRYGVLVHKPCSFSKSLAMHNARIRIVIDNHNCTLK